MNLNINDFSGPLDLLLHMVKKHQMDIYEIDIKIIIDEYIEFMNSLDYHDLDSKSEYLIMASELIHLKSKMLLGFDDEEEETTPYEINSEEELKQRIIEFAKYQNISNDFRLLESNRQEYYTKLPESLKEYLGVVNDLPGSGDINDLLEAFQNLQERIEYKKPKDTKITHKELSIKDKTNYIKGILLEKNKVEFTELMETKTKEDLVITFLSILEMGKKNEVYLSQSQNFSTIFIEARNE